MCKIVIVEDESLERQALRSILTDRLAGCTILGEAATGGEAMAFIDRGGIDLMLVDINIPRPNGLEVLHYLRQKSAATKVIITTAHDKFDMAREAIRLKADEYLLKPVRPQILVDTIQSCLNILPDQSRQLRAQMERLSVLLAQDLYREGVMLLREYVNSIYGQQKSVPDQLIRELSDALLQLGTDQGLAPDELRAHAERLRLIRVDRRNRRKVMTELLSVLDALFEVAHENFGHTSDPMQKALNYIERNLFRGTTLEETAEHAHVSSCYLSRLFKKTLGVTFIAYLTGRRMGLAKELLQGSDMPVNAISLELSYNDLNYFCKCFKREVGMSPSNYRKLSASAL
ncbi:MAG: response regulator [Deltaproteobacteria bacterium]|jgi:YesN/AraC family two-component response regulator|nr:response regulator [Deltaproteobacteria bacterium]